MNADENRLRIIELAIQSLQDDILQDEQRIGALEQAQSLTGGGFSGGGGSSGAFFAITPSSGSWGATGTFPSLTPGQFTANIYAAGGTTASPTLTLVASSANVNNWFPASPVNSKVIEIFVDGAGNYVTGPQSCS
jgi:hypothetical protein